MNTPSLNEDTNVSPDRCSFLTSCLERSTLLFSIKMSLIVGTLLVFINHGQAFLAGHFSLDLLFPLLLTYMVPFAVAMYGQVQGKRQRDCVGTEREAHGISSQSVPGISHWHAFCPRQRRAPKGREIMEKRMDSSILSEKHLQDQAMRLTIYVTQQCTNCQEALVIAHLAQQIAGLQVCVIDLDQPGQQAPTCVVGVPTYLLDGVVVSQGNPRREEFLLRLQQKIKEERP